MLAKKPVRKPDTAKGCDACTFKHGDFFADEVDPTVIRVYCKARHVNVNAELMSKEGCDFWDLSKDYERPKENESRYGL